MRNTTVGSTVGSEVMEGCSKIDLASQNGWTVAQKYNGWLQSAGVLFKNRSGTSKVMECCSEIEWLVARVGLMRFFEGGGKGVYSYGIEMGCAAGARWPGPGSGPGPWCGVNVPQELRSDGQKYKVMEC